MNKTNLDLLFRNYLDHFDYFDTEGEGLETYKWFAAEQVQNVWDLNDPDLSGMIKKAFSQTFNLINNRIVSPGNGLMLVAKEEPDAVRKALEGLLADTEDVDEKQENIIRFVDDINALLEKHYPGKWKYTQDLRVAVTYLALIDPAHNYLYKSTPAHDFARWMEFDTDLGYGDNFKLKFYYQMCDELLAEVNARPDILERDATRKCNWKDKSNHILVTDLIYCFSTYNWMREGLNEPVPRNRKGTAAAQQADRARRAAELQTRLDELQDAIDSTEKEIGNLPQIDYTGKTIRTKLYGEVTVDKQEGNYLTFTAEGKQRQYLLPGCVCNGFMLAENADIAERYRKEAELLEKVQQLNKEQRLVNLELGKY